jgi:hypothetical protein
VIFSAILVLSTVSGSALAAGGAEIDVASDDGERIVLHYVFGDYHTSSVTIGGEDYVQIWLPGEPVSAERGSPALPYVNRSVIIPDDRRMEIRVLSSAYETTVANVAPSKGRLPRTVDPDSVFWSFGDAYDTDAFLPGSAVALSEPYIMRDQRGAVVEVRPFQYNAVSGELRVYSEITLEIVAVGPGEVNVLDRTVDRRVRTFEEIYDTHFLNHGSQQDYAPIDEEGDMLVIAHDAWLSNMDSFASHKQSVGIPTTVVGVSTIGNDPVSIKAYIQNLYDTSDLAFVLLVGDAAQVATPQASGGASDPSYSKLAGSDDYPEILVGRFSAQTVDHVDTQVQRTIDYESLPATGEAWFKRGTGIASAEGAGIGDEGQSDIQHMNEIRDWLLADGYTEVDQIYDPGATDTMVADAVNAGRGIINYVGHGSSTSWGTTGFNVADVNALVNDNMLPFIVDVACVNGNFDSYDTCFAEAWLRATNNGNPTGAIAMYASSINQSWAPPMEGQDEFNILLTDPERPYHSFGAMCFAGSSSMMDKYGGSGVEMFNTWHIFGDPSLRIVGSAGSPTTGLRVTPETGLAASGPAGGPYDTDTAVYTLRNLDDTPLDYEVTCDESWVSIANASGTLAAGASTQVTVTLTEGSCNLDCGGHGDTVRFRNLTNADGNTTRPVSVTVGTVLTVGSWDMGSDPGWAPEGEWEYGVPTGGGSTKDLNPDPTAGATGSAVYGANLGGAISKAPSGPFYLTLGPVDLTGIQDVSVTFQRWLNTYGPPDVSSTVEASSNGSSWSTVWSVGELTADVAWSSQTFDLSSVVDGAANAYLRWGYQVVNRRPHTGAGWNVDDVRIEGLPLTARVHLTVEPGALSWSAVPGASGYDVVRGDLGALRVSGGDFSLATEACLGDDLPATTLDFPTDPPAGAGFWFLVRGVGSAGAMTYQSLDGNQVGLRDPGIEAAGPSCP